MSLTKNYYHEEINEAYRLDNLDAEYNDWQFHEWCEEMHRHNSNQQQNDQPITDPNDPHYLPF
jgi:hypothetical protein